MQEPMNTVLDVERGPTAVDRHVGLRIRMRRRELGMSQERLADAIGLTFQQVQKYERAANRVSASKLWEIAKVLRSNIAYFYEGLEDGGGEGGVSATHDFLLTNEGMELAATFPTIAPRLRRKVLELVRMLGDPGEE
jgi:transcriptional regulator with XRE-family HTH domain